MYGDQDYWENSYHQGVVGHSRQNRVVSNKWYVLSPALRELLRNQVDIGAGILILDNVVQMWARAY